MANRPPTGRYRRSTSSEDGGQRQEPPPRMTRGVSQLLFNYLPQRTVDWEDGLAIVQLGNVQLGDIWSSERSRIVLDEVALLLDRWRGLGGTVDPNFPDPRQSGGRFALGTPVGIDASILRTAMVCQRCSTLAFPQNRQGEDGVPQRCACGGQLRQFGQVFVHGCGELVPLGPYIPWARAGDGGALQPTNRPLRCDQCGDRGVLRMPARSDRVADMTIICNTCGSVVVDRMAARCPRCTRNYAKSNGQTRTGSPVARVAMRMSRYSANDTYYPQTTTLLRLDRPALTTQEDPEQRELRALLPLGDRPDVAQSPADMIAALNERLRRAEQIGDSAERERVLARIVAIATGSHQQDRLAPDDAPVPATASDIPKAIRESLAFRTTVNTRPALALARESSAGQLLASRTSELQRTLGLREIGLVDDLPVITATYGYTRRSFEPTYDELGAKGLSTEVRVFPSLDSYAANRLGQQDLVGTVPILAREGEHQGLFLSLNPDRVVTWLTANGVTLPPGPGSLTRILTALEPIDRFYDQIWECPVRRMVYGLVHSLSHAAMRTASWFSGLERTSLSEYIFLPLLGTVVFDTAGAFQLGGIESLVRDHLTAFLEELSSDAHALSCLYDADCIDGKGACHGCIHSPEIACRAFNHGLSRSFLLGGHTPWLDISRDDQLTGYWQLGGQL